MQSLDSLYSQTIPVNFHNRAMRQKCLEFIIYMFITKWDKENLQTCSCYMFFSEWASQGTKWNTWPMICGFECWNSALINPSVMFVLIFSHWLNDLVTKRVHLGLELTYTCCLHDNWVGSVSLERWQTSFAKCRKYGALNDLLHACEMLRAHVKFSEVFPPQITSNLQTN